MYLKNPFLCFLTYLADFNSNCISTHPGNALVILNVYVPAFPSLLSFTFGFEQTQKLTVKLRESLAPPTSLTFKGDELSLCFQESVPEKL